MIEHRHPVDQARDIAEEIAIAESGVNALVDRFVNVSEKLKNWQTLSFTGALPHGSRPDPPRYSRDALALEYPVPALIDVQAAQKKWLDAQRKLQELRNSADEETWQTIQTLHPDWDVQTTVRYMGRQPSS